MDVMKQKNRRSADDTWSTWAVASKYGLALEGPYGYRVGSVLEVD